MADETPVMGHQTRYAIGASAPTTKILEVMQFGIIGSIQNVRNQGARGTRSHFSTGIREGVKTCEGNVTLEPRVDELALLLPYILFGTPSGTTYPLAEAPVEHVWDADLIEKAIRYSGCVVNRATFRSSAGQPLSLTLDVIGKDWDDTITFPSLSNYSAYAPFMHHDLVVEIDSLPYYPESLVIVVDNRVQPMHRSSQTRRHLRPADRIITVSMQLGYSEDEQVLHQLSATAAKAGTFTYTNGAVSLAFATPALQTPKQTSPMQNRSAEISRQFQWQARAASAALDELVVTLDSTP